MIQQAKINSFINSIKDTAEEKRAAISAETQHMLDSETAEMEAQAKKAADDYINAKTASIRLEAGRRISESASECRKKVFSRRNEIADKTLSSVAEKLGEFTKSEEYKAFLFGCAEKILDDFGSGNVTLLLRPEDMKFEAELEAKFPNASVSQDDSIRIGGLKGINSIVTLLIDDTLDSRLEQQKRWFEENSGLYISMR